MTRAQLTSARLMYRVMIGDDAPALLHLFSQWDVVRQLGSYPWPPLPPRGLLSMRGMAFRGVRPPKAMP